MPVYVCVCMCNVCVCVRASQNYSQLEERTERGTEWRLGSNGHPTEISKTSLGTQFRTPLDGRWMAVGWQSSERQAKTGFWLHPMLVGWPSNGQRNSKGLSSDYHAVQVRIQKLNSGREYLTLEFPLRLSAIFCVIQPTWWITGVSWFFFMFIFWFEEYVTYNETFKNYNLHNVSFS